MQQQVNNQQHHRPQMSGQNQQFDADLLRDSVVNAVSSVVSAIEPQIHDMASKMASRAATEAVDRSRSLALSAWREARRQPWYFIGAAALILVGAAFLIGFDRTGSLEAKLS